MTRCFHHIARMMLGIVAGTMAVAPCVADDGPTLLGPDARPPRMTPTVQGRQAEEAYSAAASDNRAANARRAPAVIDRRTGAAGPPYADQAAPQARAAIGNFRPQSAQNPQSGRAFGQATAERSAPPWSQANRAAEPQYRQAPRPGEQRMSPEQIERYRAQMQQRNGTAYRDPREQQIANQQRRESIASRSQNAPPSNRPKRNYRSLFEPPSARTAQAPGQPRPIVIGGAPGMSQQGHSMGANRGQHYNGSTDSRSTDSHPGMGYGNSIGRGPMQGRSR